MNDYTIFSVNNNDAIVVLIIVSTAAVVAAVSLLLEIKFWPEMKTKEKRATTSEQHQTIKNKHFKKNKTKQKQTNSMNYHNIKNVQI